jgi:hypothetical protein
LAGFNDLSGVKGEDTMIKPNDLAGKVVGYTGGAAIKRIFGLDTRTYGWVEDFVRDESCRKKIETLKQKIAEAQALPIHKDELRNMFDDQVKKVNSFRIAQLKANLSDFQSRRERIIDELYMDNRLILGAKPYPFLMSFSAEDLEKIFSDLPEGAKQKDIDKTVSRYQAKIKELETVIKSELSPPGRWFHKDNGAPIPYPQGCRWTPFVETWRKVAARFDGKVNIEGEALKAPEEFAAYHLLDLDRVTKLPPLKTPY